MHTDRDARSLFGFGTAFTTLNFAMGDLVAITLDTHATQSVSARGAAQCNSSDMPLLRACLCRALRCSDQTFINQIWFNEFYPPPFLFISQHAVIISSFSWVPVSP